MRTQRDTPGIDIDQIDSDSINGGLNAPQLQGFGGGLTTPGHNGVFDENGCIIDGPPSNTHAELLTDGAGNIIFANGDVIYVTGIPS